MGQQQREDIACFRFGVISDLVGGVRLAPGDAAKLIKEKSLQRYNIPFSDRTRISVATIRRWIRLYEANGRKLESLYPARRADKGESRRVDDETIAALVRLRKEKPNTPVSHLLKEMADKKLITSGTVLAQSTAYRILKKEGLSRGLPATKTDRRRFEAEFPNDIWQSDVMHGPSVEDGGKHRKTYLIAFLDDHSRILPHAQFYTSERLHCYLDAFRQALLTRGLPRKLYVDNGAAFRSKHLEKTCASLGMALVHTPPYTPQGRGKIERFFQTVRSRFLPYFLGDTLYELNEAFDLWISEDYHQRLHSSTGETPLNRFARHVELLRAAPPDLEDHFRKEVRRRVAKDRTVSINNVLFEAPVNFIGEYVRLLFHEHKPDQVELFAGGRSHGMLNKVDLHVNCRVKRERDHDRLVPTEPQGKSCQGGQLRFTSPEEVKA